MRQKRFQQIVLIISILSFLGSTGYGAVAFLNKELNAPPKQDAKTVQAKAVATQLQQQEQGYELVLKREPGNQAALVGLVKIRLQKNDLKGAVEPMEKLVKLNPDRADYKALLAELKQK